MKIRFFLKWGRAFLAAFLIAGFALLLGQASNAFAHEDRDVLSGKYHFRVGFISEPTYQGLLNGIELVVCTGTSCITNKDGSGTYTNGITGLFDTLKAEVIFGEQSITLPLVAVPRNPGRYNANFIPTRTGDYTFHFFGTIGSDKIDEKFTSGPDTFDSVLPLTTIQFPDKPGYVASTAIAASGGSTSPVPATTAANSATIAPASTSTPAATPATNPAASTNNDAVLQQLQAQLQDQKQQLESAKNSAASANTFGIIGIVAGILGIIIAAAAFFFGGRGKGAQPEAG